MREDCKFFQTRMYASGELTSFCALKLAPEAPWRCPEGCARYQKRLRTDPAGPCAPAPPEPGSIAGVAQLLGQAAGIVNAAGPEIIAEQERTRRRREEARQPWWERLREQAKRRR